MKKTTRLLFGIGFAFAGLSNLATVLAQSSTTQGTRGRPDVVQRELQRRLESEAIEQALAARSGHRNNQAGRLLLAQIKEDFLQIQVINDDLKKAASRSDFKGISKTAGEIVKRSQRLKENLALPKPDKVAAQAETSSQSEIRELMLQLDRVIGSFVENPVFEKLGVVDAKLSTKAGGDLEQIIIISKQVKKSS